MIPEDVINKIRKDAFDRKHVIPQSQFIEVAEYGYSLATEQQEKELERKGMIIVSKLAWEQLQASKKEIERLKGLIGGAWEQSKINCEVENGVGDAGEVYKAWQQFKTDNNLL